MGAVEGVSRRVPRLFQSATRPAAAANGDVWSGTANAWLEKYFGGSWYAAARAGIDDLPVVNALGQGAVADARKLVGKGSISTSGTLLTSLTSNTFTAADVGKGIAVAGAGASLGGGAFEALVTTIAGYTSPTQVTLAAAATTGVLATDFVFGTDNHAAGVAAHAAAATAGARAHWPAGGYYTSARFDAADGLTVEGAGNGRTAIHCGANLGNFGLFHAAGSLGTPVNLSANAARGAVTVTTATDPLLLAGGYAYLETNRTIGGSGTPDHQTARVKSVSGSGPYTITLDGALVRDFNSLAAFSGVTGSMTPSLATLGGTMTASSAALALTTGTLNASDVGKAITVRGAGANGADLATTISAFTDSTHVTLAAAATTAVTAAAVRLTYGNRVLIVTAGTLAGSDVGREVTVAGAGAAGATLTAVIQSLIDGTHAVLSVACTTAVTSAAVASAATQATITPCTAPRVRFAGLDLDLSTSPSNHGFRIEYGIEPVVLGCRVAGFDKHGISAYRCLGGLVDGAELRDPTHTGGGQGYAVALDGTVGMAVRGVVAFRPRHAVVLTNGASANLIDHCQSWGSSSNGLDSHGVECNDNTWSAFASIGAAGDGGSIGNSSFTGDLRTLLVGCLFLGNQAGYGLRIYQGSHRTRLLECEFLRTFGAAIFVGDSDDVTIRGGIIAQHGVTSATYGIEASFSQRLQVDGIRISDSVQSGSGGVRLQVGSHTARLWFRAFNLFGAACVLNASDNAHVGGDWEASNGAQYGLQMTNALNATLIPESRITGHYQPFNMATGSDGLVAQLADLLGNTSYAWTLTGTKNRIFGCRGYRTEATGTGTVASGGTSVTVTHGLAAAPTRVLLSFTADTGGKRLWVSAKGATTFTVTADSAVGADVTFDWRAVLGDEV